MRIVWLFIMVVIVAWGQTAYANNIAVANVLVGNQVTGTPSYNIQFDVSWDNSWFTTGAPSSTANWDAAWVFAKFSKWNSGTSTWSAWAHCTLSKTAGNHTAPTGSQITVGCSPSYACGGGDTGKGIFIYRSAAGTGSVSWPIAKMQWLYGTDGVADIDRVKVQVFGVEMVYIPTAAFDIGDGSSTPAGNFQLAGGSGPVNVGAGWTAAVNGSSGGGNDDDAQIKAPGAGLLISGSGGIKYADGSNLNASYPTGYGAFYVMKYDASQREYTGFLNNLTRGQQGMRVSSDVSTDAPSARYVMSASATVQQRDAIAAPATGNGITAAIIFGNDMNANSVLDEAADGGWNTAVDLNWMDQAAFSAWAGLRPLTELEFEKAARGPTGAVADEYAWGNTTVYNSNGASNDYALATSGTTSETISNPGSGLGNAAYYLTSCSSGPNYSCGSLRNGIFAASAGTKNRQETGGSYYGVMGLSGNVWKRVVTVGNTAGRAFIGTHGSGVLSVSGNAVNSDWPGYAVSEVTGATGMGLRGGSWMSLSTSLRVSDRGFGADATTLRTYVYGIRAGRTAP